MRLINQTTTIEDLQSNPRAYGLPTLADFASNPRKWRSLLHRGDSSFSSLDDGPKTIRNILKKVKLKIHGVSLSSIEDAEKAIGDYGYTISDFEWGKDGTKSRLKYEVKMLQEGAGKYDVEINFLP